MDDDLLYFHSTIDSDLNDEDRLERIISYEAISLAGFISKQYRTIKKRKKNTNHN